MSSIVRISAVTVVLSLASLPVPAPAADAPAPKGAEAPVQVKLARTEDPGGGAWVAASLAATRHATVSTRIAASVEQVLVSEGAKVAQGQVLVRLSASDVRGQLAAAETALRNATAHEKRITELAAARAAIPVEVEQAEAQRAQAAAAVAAAKATLAYTELRAPFAGTVQSRKVNVGDLVGPGQPIVEVQGDGLEVQATLSEAETKGLQLGQRLRFASEGTEGDAEITALSPGGDSLSHRRTLRARVLGGTKGLRSGAFARIEVPGAPRATVAWVPRSAIVDRGDLCGVFVLRDGKAHLRWLAVGEPAGDRIPVRAGLKSGEQVIDLPGALRDGQRVEVVRGG